MSSVNVSANHVDGVPLFACTKCNSRHPFEELSAGNQMCRACEGSLQIIKCNYCRSEFKQERKDDGSKSSSICSKCEQLQEQHGKPGPCVYCNIIAAFIGTKCQRCTNSEKKYGSPMSCEHCRQKCAFDRKDPESRRKVDGKLLCWLCTMAYKRTLAKARQKEAILKSTSNHSKSAYSRHSRSHIAGDNGTSNGHRHSSLSTNSSNTAGAPPPPSGAGGSISNSLRHSSSSQHLRSHYNSSSSGAHSSSHRDHSTSSSANKKQRLDIAGASNGHLTSSLSSFSDTRFLDPTDSDLAAVVTQLKDQVGFLNKKIQLKEKELLSKDQQIAELKSSSTREQRELREKINTLQKQHAEKISEMQAKLVALQKQIASQSKSARPVARAYVEPPMVI